MKSRIIELSIFLVAMVFLLSIATYFYPANAGINRSTPQLADKDESTHTHSAEKISEAGEKSVCSEHRVPEDECAVCQPELTKTMQPGDSLKIRFNSLESAAKAGIQSISPLMGDFSDGLSFFCQVSYNQNHHAHITTLVDGVIQRVLTNVGDEVKEGQVLLEIASTKIAETKSEYLTSIANELLKEKIYNREKELVSKRISAQQDYQQSEAEFRMAKIATTTSRQRLLNFGFTEDEVRKIVETHSNSAVVQIRAPFSGVLIEQEAVVGEAATPGKSLFQLTDLSTMWLELSIPEDQITLVKIGDLIQAGFNGLPSTQIDGKIIWISSNVDEHSRMVKARALISNPGYLLKHGMFGQVKIRKEPSVKGLFVPQKALQEFEGNFYVFVKQTEDLFELRRVLVGGRNHNYVELVKGISPQEAIVTDHSFTLKSEFLKSKFGAGCADD